MLKASTILNPTKLTDNSSGVGSLVQDTLLGHSYYVDLPGDYLHMINCVVEYKANANFKCYNNGDSVYFAARRLTSDMYAQIINNAYLRPMYKRPYYYLNNINTKPSNYKVTDKTEVTNNGIDSEILDYNKGSFKDGPQGTNFTPNHTPRENKYDGEYDESNLLDSENTAGDRLANPSIVRLELRFGKDDSIFTPQRLYIDYVKAPMYIRLTQEQIDSTLDYSQVLEFPDYVCFEIVNIFTRLLMENASDPRLQTNMPINNTIANPALQQAAQNNNK